MAITPHLSSNQPPHHPTIFFPSTNTPTTLVSFVRTSQPSHRLHRNQHFLPRVPSSSFRNGSNTPSETGCPVPLEQQPINEYQNLSTSFPFSWAAGDFIECCSRLFVTGASFALLVGLPVAWLGAPSPESEPLKRVLGAVSSGIVVVTLAVVRMYLGWAYVGNRLLSATVEYEETGWYDGQDAEGVNRMVVQDKNPVLNGFWSNYGKVIWVKTAEVLARDRLLGSFSVKPVLSKLKYTLVTLAVSLFACVFLLVNIDESQKASNKSFEANRERAIPGVYSDNSARFFEPDAFCGEPGVPQSVD